MTLAWTLVSLALALGAFAVGWCFGCDTGERATNERWQRFFDHYRTGGVKREQLPHYEDPGEGLV